jgi:hypothetical protein
MQSQLHSSEEIYSYEISIFLKKILRIWIGLLIRNMTSSTKTISQFQHESRSNRQFSNENIVLAKDGSVTFPWAG